MEHPFSLRRPLLAAGLVAFGATLLTLALPVTVSLLLAGLLLLLVVLLHRRSTAVFLLVCGALFLFAGGVYQWGEALPQTALAGETDTLTGCVVDTSATGHMVVVQVEEATLLPAGSRVLLYAPDLCAPDLGERVTAPVTLKALTSSQEYRRSDGIFLSAFPTGFQEDCIQVLASLEEPATLSVWFANLRQHLAGLLCRALPGEEGALLAAICLGEDSALSPEVQDAFRNSGLSHLLVVSGLHLTILSGSILAFLRLCRAERRLSLVLTMVATVAFMLLIGPSPSVIRAGIMTLVFLAGRLLFHPPEGLNSLGFALLLILLWNPYMAVDAGLLLSFVATAGVLVLSPRLYRYMVPVNRPVRRKGFSALALGFWKTVAAALSACFGATLPLAPLLWFYFRGLSWTAPLSNLLTVIPSGWCLVMGWVALLLLPLGAVGAALAQGPLFLAAMPARWLLWTTEWLGDPSAQVSLPYVWQGVVLTALVIGCILLISPPRWLLRRVVAVFLSLSVLAAGVGQGLDRGAVHLWFCPDESSGAVMVRQDAHAVLLISDADALYAARQVAEDGGLTLLDGVVMGEHTAASAAGLTALADRYDAPRVYVTSSDRTTAGWHIAPERLTQGQPVPLWEGAFLEQTAMGWCVTVAGKTVSIHREEERLCLTAPGVACSTADPASKHYVIR